jgi:hypothetical protein
MDHSGHETSAVKTWFLILLMVGWVAFKGWLAVTVIGDLGQPDWDYRPIMDVPGESAYTIDNPYHALPYAQHVRGALGKEENPLHLKVLPFQGVE